MHERHRRLGRLAVALGAVLAGLAWSNAASAYHDEQYGVTDATARTLPGQTFRLGLWKFQYSIVDELTVGTLTLPWIIRAPSLHVKWRFLSGDRWALGTQLGWVNVNTDRIQNLIDEDKVGAKANLVPFAIFSTFGFDEKWWLHPGVGYTFVDVSGRFDTASLNSGGDGATSNLQVFTTLEWRWTKVTAFLLHGRYLIFQNAVGEAEGEFQADPFTTVDATAGADTDEIDFKAAWSLVLSAQFSWSSTNLRVGAGYGNWSLPGINFVAGKKTPIADLDLYWVF